MPRIELLTQNWIEMVRADIFDLFLILEGKYSVFTTSYNIFFGFSLSFIRLKKILLFSICKVFIFWKSLDFVKSQFVSPRDSCSIWFFIINIVFYIDWFSDFNHCCTTRINPTWSYCIIFFMYFLIHFHTILLRNFAFIRFTYLYYCYLLLSLS